MHLYALDWWLEVKVLRTVAGGGGDGGPYLEGPARWSRCVSAISGEAILMACMQRTLEMFNLPSEGCYTTGSVVTFYKNHGLRTFCLVFVEV